MKKLYLFLLATLTSYASLATHGMGGEITWVCNGTDYVFTLKFYRDCNGIPGPQVLTMQSNVPGVPNIPMNLVSQTDISPDGSDSSGVTACPTCPNAGGSTGGAVEEFVFQSNPVALPGVPPAGGWTFWYMSCCRSNALENVTGGGGYGFALRAKMYPFFGQTAGQCSDNSPSFAERPSLIICTGYPFTYSHLATDIDRDSLSYSFDILLDDGGSPPVTAVPFAPGYSVTSPLPSATQNPNNVAAAIDPYNGQISFTSFTQGYFATSVKAQSYKCGQLAAEIFREINIVLISGCQIPVMPPVANNPPAIDYTFADSTGNYAVYDTTVHAGDTLHFALSASDFDPHPVLGMQDVTLHSVSEQYGTGYTSTTAGCLIPPCATLTPPPPVTAAGVVTTQFDWITTTAHLGLNFGCVYLGNVYYFLAKGMDNFCPANGQHVETFRITVEPNTPVPPVTNTGGVLTCLLFTGNYNYQWFLDRFAIPGATGNSYTPTATGTYQVLAWDPVTGDGNYSAGIQVNVTGIYEIDGGLTQLDLFPNPTFDQSFTLSFEAGRSQDVTLRVTDVTGRLQQAHTWSVAPGTFREKLFLDGPAGVYLVEVANANGSVVKKVVVL